MYQIKANNKVNLCQTVFGIALNGAKFNFRNATNYRHLTAVVLVVHN